jgi:hypothetical protein
MLELDGRQIEQRTSAAGGIVIEALYAPPAALVPEMC